jgi:A/G-specific adenine glycosylase
MKREPRMHDFAEKMWMWFRVHKRTLPWRNLRIEDDSERAYLILVSEVMLQQTQVPRVVTAFRRFLEQFPTLEALAGASNRDVLLVWRGMGYNSRALRLRDAARAIVERHGGDFPRDMETLRSLPGIGPYTAAAIRNFAFGIPTACADTNIRRILERVFRRDALSSAGDVLRIALDRGRTQDWHAALMDFGSAVCAKSAPKCAACPLSKGICRSAFKVKAERRAANPQTEPGRMVGSRFIPNRIFRGRVIDLLRDAPDGLSLDRIGSHVCIDWDPRTHATWLKRIVEKLTSEELLERKRARYLLKA